MKLKRLKSTIILSVMFLIIGIGISFTEAFEYFPSEVGHRWVYTPSYGDGNRVDMIVGTEEINGVLTQVWKREESAPDNYHEKRWMADDGESIKMYKIWGNMALNPAVEFNPPVVVGKRNFKVGETSHLEMKMGDMHLNVTSYVESMSDVMKVPAGTFSNCLAIREKSEITHNGITKYDYEKTWYAPGIGPIVFRKYSQNWETATFSQELVSFSNVGSLHMDINTGQDVYETGDTLTAFTSIFNAGSCQMADIYIALKLSDGTLLFYPEYTKTIRPVLSEPINICGSPFVGDYNLIEMIINDGFPKGDYVWYAVLNRLGADVLDKKNWLSFDEAPFSVK